MTKLDPIPLILKALDFSATKHRDQRRKDREASPYINHPIAVAEVLASVAGVRDPAILAAAILHDTVEDTDTTPEEIESLFGQRVSSLVLEVTDDKSLPKARRKQLQVEHAPHMSEGAKLIKIADKISNLHDIINSPPAWPLKSKRGYMEWTADVVAGARGVSPELEALYDQLLAEGRTRLVE